MNSDKAACSKCGGFDWELQEKSGTVEIHTLAAKVHEVSTSHHIPSRYNFRCPCGYQASGREFGDTVRPKWMAELIEAMHSTDDEQDGFYRVDED